MRIKESDLSNVKKIGIYCITNLVNGKKYVGKTGRKEYGFIKRWENHNSELNNNKSNCTYLQNAWNKYGIDNFEFSILEIVEPTDDTIKLNQIMDEREQYWIDKYDTFNNGYNLTKGGDGTLGIESWCKGLTKETDERVKKISDTLKNKPKTEYHRHKLSIVNIGKKRDKLSIEKQRNTLLNKYHNGNIKHWAIGKNKQNCKSIRDGIKKRKQNYLNGMYSHPLLGKHHNEETKQKISISKRMSDKCKGKNHPLATPIFQLTLDGKLVREYDYIGQVEEYGFNVSNVGLCINHNHITKLGDNVYGKRGKEKYIWTKKYNTKGKDKLC